MTLSLFLSRSFSLSFSLTFSLSFSLSFSLKLIVCAVRVIKASCLFDCFRTKKEAMTDISFEIGKVRHKNLQILMGLPVSAKLLRLTFNEKILDKTVYLLLSLVRITK